MSADGGQLTRSLSVDVVEQTGVARVGQIEQPVGQLSQRVLGRHVQQRRRLAVQSIYSAVVTD